MPRRARHGEMEIGGREVEKREKREENRKTERGEREKVGHLGSCHLTSSHSRPPPTHGELALFQDSVRVDTQYTQHVYRTEHPDPS